MDIQIDDTTAAIAGGVFLVLFLVSLLIAMIVAIGLWKSFQKAGEPGWAAIIPIYNLFVMTKITGRPAWWAILAIIPFVNLVAVIVLNLDLAKAFGKDSLYGLGMALLPFIFYPMLGFGQDQYQGAPA